jgi:hypothetical protein
MSATRTEYFRQRYRNDEEYRRSLVEANRRYMERKKAEDPVAFEAARAARAVRKAAEFREKYQNDPEFRERHLEAQRARRRVRSGIINSV